MKRTALFFASTAILFSSPTAMADQPALNRPYISSNSNDPAPVLMAQAEEAAPPAEEAAPEADGGGQERKRKSRQQADQPDETQQRAEEAQQRAAEESAAAENKQRQAEESARKQADQAAQEAEAEGNRQAEKARRAAEADAEKAAEQQKAVEREAKQKAAQEAEDAQAKQQETNKAAERAKREAQAEADKAAEQQKANEAEAKQKAAEELKQTEELKDQTAKEAEKAKREAQTETDKAAEQQKAAEEDARKKADRGQKAAEKDADKAAEQAKRAADKAAQEKPADATGTAPAPTGEQPAAPTNEAQPAQPAQPDQAAQPAQPAPGATGQEPGKEASPLPENAAPVLDSEKKAARPDAGATPGTGNAGATPDAGAPATAPAAQQEAQPEQPAAAAPAAPPKSDAEVQQELTPVKIESIRSQEGKRTKEPRRWERPDDAQVVKQFDNRTIVEVNNNVFVESSDRPRMTRKARDVYYEDLPRDRTRETIVRDNGVEIITIRNRYGDVIQRSRLMPDGREVVLSYAPEYDRAERMDWRDPGDDLPPLRLAIPVREYILDAEDVPEEEVYDFFAQPPVERVERLYSIDEVRRSARIRDKVRRVDLDTITFQFGSAEISEDQIGRLESVAKAIAQTLEKNPAETFLIEGHTDAVGSDQANLVLSDKRAEAVAQALTNVFDIPPENMTTQGYGEQYLKISTQEPEQQNRRVAIRRITPLVAPMASNN
ncbi:OmpA family protein [Phyllobacterium sp. 21LDTY02-6]|uniref:OmpA family protein n=1 Tax=Phyllobacterium sp. 21LDTY02-6 TaxID=2944903 RepID=UPI002021C421|nr:OmpA family protein [Phyllobacterium sp. 21LDTY02-6]MCO4315874.1 OmpA family protein [Phyllobacterium sp. 21LDTY02-6]